MRPLPVRSPIGLHKSRVRIRAVDLGGLPDDPLLRWGHALVRQDAGT